MSQTEANLIREFTTRCEILVRRGECSRDVYEKSMMLVYKIEDLRIIDTEYDDGRHYLRLFVIGCGPIFEAYPLTNPLTNHFRWSEPITLYREHAINVLRKHMVLDDLSKV